MVDFLVFIQEVVLLAFPWDVLYKEYLPSIFINGFLEPTILQNLLKLDWQQ